MVTSKTMSNRISVKITDIKKSGDLCHLFLEFNEINLSLVMLSSNFKVGDTLDVGVKETAVAVMKEKGLLSYSNQIPVTITSVELGDILTKITASYKSLKLVSIITSNSASRLNLKVDDEVWFLIKATDMFVV